MLQFIMEQNLLLYLIAAASAVSVASQIILKQIYEGLIRDIRNTGEPEGRFLQQLRQRFQYCSHLNDQVGDVHALIQKALMDYRFWGMSLHRWKRIGAEGLIVALSATAAGVISLVRGGNQTILENPYVWYGLMASILTALAYGIADTGYSRKSLVVRLTDYLENSGSVKNFREEEEEYDEAIPVFEMETGRKMKRKARKQLAQTRAQKEKTELKEHMARMKAGLQESAAEREKEKHTEALRQMDAREQERIIREVLREVLAGS